MSMTTDPTATDTATPTDQAVTTQLVTAMTYLGAGPAAIADLQSRIDQITGADNRFTIGEIKTDTEGQPVCDVSFNCASYDPPVDGRPDPRALDDFYAALAKINPDGCVMWAGATLLHN